MIVRSSMLRNCGLSFRLPHDTLINHTKVAASFRELGLSTDDCHWLSEATSATGNVGEWRSSFRPFLFLLATAESEAAFTLVFDVLKILADVVRPNRTGPTTLAVSVLSDDSKGTSAAVRSQFPGAVSALCFPHKIFGQDKKQSLFSSLAPGQTKEAREARKLNVAWMKTQIRHQHACSSDLMFHLRSDIVLRELSKDPSDTKAVASYFLTVQTARANFHCCATGIPTCTPNNNPQESWHKHAAQGREDDPAVRVSLPVFHKSSVKVISEISCQNFCSPIVRRPGMLLAF